jgi:hypothetical protein
MQRDVTKHDILSLQLLQGTHIVLPASVPCCCGRFQSAAVPLEGASSTTNNAGRGAAAAAAAAAGSSAGGGVTVASFPGWVRSTASASSHTLFTEQVCCKLSAVLVHRISCGEASQDQKSRAQKVELHDALGLWRNPSSVTSAQSET